MAGGAGPPPREGPLRIGVISNYLPSGSKIGVGHQAHDLANALADRGHDVTVHSLCGATPGARYRTRTLEITGPARTFRFAAALRRVDWSAFDVVHAHGDDYWLWGSPPPRVRTLHGSCFDEALRIRGARERIRMLALGVTEVVATLAAERSVVVSPGTRRWTPWVRDVVPNGVDLRRFRPDPGAREDHPVVLFVGTYGGRKRGAELVAAFASVRAVHPAAELWMVSRDVPVDAGPGVRALGRVDDQTLADLYRRAWVFCLPSSYEGFGIPYVEAMASGLPVVATPNTGVRYVTREGRDGRLVPLDRLGDAITDLLADDGERRRLADAGLARARAFALDAVVDEYEEIYRELVGAGSRR